MLAGLVEMPEKVDGIATLKYDCHAVLRSVEMPEKVDGIATHDLAQRMFSGLNSLVEMPEKVDGIATSCYYLPHSDLLRKS